MESLTFESSSNVQFTGGVPPEEATINVDIIYPATEKHISKYAEQRYFLVSDSPHFKLLSAVFIRLVSSPCLELQIQETPAQYKAVTKPFIDSISPFRVQWVYNILDGKVTSCG